jgi:tRNA-specific 2-thiouridylase
MSGGVDSSVAAALLVEQGYEVVGVTMKLFCHGDELPHRPCCSIDSISDARRVAAHLGIAHYVLNMAQDFAQDVVHNFAQEYARGRTPIPCVRCNTFTKFRDLVRKADAIGAAFVATGHYARVVAGQLLRGVDPAKDQSYFLWGIAPDVLPRLLLPVGWLAKQETRARARAMGLRIVADKAESQDICFVPDGDHLRVLTRILGDEAPALQPGPFLLSDGRVVGVHSGYAGFTVGQRRGLPGGFPEPMYVLAIEPATRAVIIGPRHELLERGIVAGEVNWLTAPPVVGTRLRAQVRHRAAAVSCEVIRLAEHQVEVALDEPVAAIAPGQSLVLYDGDRVVGGGVIEASRSTAARRLPVLAA